MPVWARVFAGAFGLPLLLGGMFTLIAVRPIDTAMMFVAITSVVAGSALVASAWSGVWPEWPFFLI